MDFRLVVFIGVIGLITIGLVALDYRRLGRRSISATQSERIKRDAIVHWSLSADEVKRAQRVERRRRWQRIQFIIRRNLRVASLVAVIGGGALTLLVIGSALGGHITFEARQLLIGLFPAVVIYPILIVATVFVSGDALGLAGLRSVLGLQAASAVTAHLQRGGILWEPGGFQPFTYQPTAAEVLDGDQTVLLIITTRGQLRQDFYIPVPSGCEAEVDLVRQRLYLAA